MSNVRHVLIPEIRIRGRRLGRHIEHDECSRAFSVSHITPIKTVQWMTHGPILDQGDLGSCTGNAIAAAKNTGNLYRPGDKILDESDAVILYSAATRIDRIPGFYPPDDTGSSGLAVARAAQKKGLIGSYEHAFSLEQALRALSAGPIIIGIYWKTSDDNPQGDQAELTHTGENRGGHELCVDKLDVEFGIIGGPNSWGEGWGNNGRWTMTFATFRRALKEDGDVVRPKL